MKTNELITKIRSVVHMVAPPARELLEQAAEALEECRMHSAECRMKWIPVTERLPESDSGGVLCITPAGHYHLLQWLETFNCWSDPYGIDFTNYRKGYVTHWMPLPEPPKED